MSNMLDLAPLLTSTGAIRRGHIASVSDEGSLTVKLPGDSRAVACRVMHSGTSQSGLSPDDEVLVWLGDSEDDAIVLGRIDECLVNASPVVPAAEFEARPRELILEAQGDIILLNGQARLKIGADGEVEITCASFTTRSHRLLRLLSPLINLN